MTERKIKAPAASKGTEPAPLEPGATNPPPNNDKPPILGQLKSGVTAGILGAIITGIVSGLGTVAVALWAFVTFIPWNIGLTPTGAVMAFDLATGCPPGWKDFDEARARVLIGAATQDQINNNMPTHFAQDDRKMPLTPKKFRDPGGHEKYMLTKADIPSLYLSYRGQGTPGGPNNDVTSIVSLTFDKPDSKPGYFNVAALNTTQSEIETMPPYVALLFCKKT